MKGLNFLADRLPDDFLSIVFAGCVEEGDCWLWQGPLNNGSPIISVPSSWASQNKPRPDSGNVYIAVRRAVFACTHNGSAHIGSRYVTPSCGHSQCVNPAHARAITSTEMARHMGKKVNTAARAMKCAKTRRERDAKLTQDRVDRIRSGGESATDLAREWDVHPSLIHRVRRGEAWKDYASPMGAMAAHLAG